ncbi:hypothetical protein MVEN_01267800 [Mycena venus]|uniref:Uncharacterized protein n=1 Tax=Mycena venus TaxID=2733690 RepID=A0A8H6Y715_9AGAR|nr:hypothetical protein MVEN_01267800 [Mycena venus]
MSVVSTDLPPSSSPSQHPSSAQIHDLEPMNQDVLNAPPPSSSPMPSSSPLYPQSLELTEPLIKSEEACGVVSPRPNIEQEEDSSIGVSASHSSTALVGSSVDFPGQKNDEGPFSHKRKRDEEEAREIIPQPPNPKRPTLASQKLQRKTLVKPFRSPAIMTPKAPEPIPPPPVLKKESVSVELLTKDDLKKHRTQRAAGQFKSPLPAAVSSSIFSAVRPTPTIQALEHKVQVLRRAVKVKKGREEETLEALAKKWTEAGREVAWEVWSLIKDQENGSADEWGERVSKRHVRKEKIRRFVGVERELEQQEGQDRVGC